MQLSIVTSAYNEIGNVEPFLDSARQAIATLGVSAEIVFFDDGSSDGTGDAVEAYAKQHADLPIRLIRRAYKQGITAAIADSYAATQGSLVCLLPADLESIPADDVPALYAALDASTDVVVGWRQDRGDGKLLASKIYNAANWQLFGVRLHDMNWIKLIRREKLQGLQLRSDWHRFLIPILAKRGCRFKEVQTQWHQRRYGRSNFGWRRFAVSIADVLTVKLLLEYGQRPLLAFGMAAFWLLSAALVISGFGIVQGFSLPVLLGLTALLTTSTLLLAIGAAVEFLLKSGER